MSPIAPASTVSAKAVMATTGLLLVGWTLLHVAGNLLTLLGPDLVNRYGAQLHDSPVLWLQRLGLTAVSVVHIAVGVRLAARSRAALGHEPRTRRATSAPWRRWRAPMRMTGLLLAGLTAAHVAHIYGAWHPDFLEGDVHHNLVTSARTWPGGGLLVALTALVGMHVGHGAQSALISLGWGAERWPKVVRHVVAGLPWLLVGGLALPITYALLS